MDSSLSMPSPSTAGEGGIIRSTPFFKVDRTRLQISFEECVCKILTGLRTLELIKKEAN